MVFPDSLDRPSRTIITGRKFRPTKPKNLEMMSTRLVLLIEWIRIEYVKDRHHHLIQ